MEEEQNPEKLWALQGLPSFKEAIKEAAATHNALKASHRKKSAFLSAHKTAKVKERSEMKARSASIRESLTVRHWKSEITQVSVRALHSRKFATR